MPLLKGKKNIGKNIKELKEVNKGKSNSARRSKEQITAIALNVAYGPKKKKGRKP